MDPCFSYQDVIRCDLCEDPMPPYHCDMCHINLCRACVVDHITDFSKEHRVVPFSERGATPVYSKCTTHSDKACELHCTECDTPVCTLCVAEMHKGHTFWSILKTFSFQQMEMKKDLEELVKIICPKYKKKTSEIESGKSGLEKEYGKLIKTNEKEGKNFHRKIDILIERRKLEIIEMKKRHLDILDKQKDKVMFVMSEIQQSIQRLNEVMDSNEAHVVCAYKSSNAKLRKLPPQVQVCLPTIYSQEINTEKLYELFSFLSPLSIICDENDTDNFTTEEYPEEVSLNDYYPERESPELYFSDVERGPRRRRLLKIPKIVPKKVLRRKSMAIQKTNWSCLVQRVPHLNWS